jgi:hypothetical protein
MPDQPVYYSVQDHSGQKFSTSIAENSCTCLNRTMCCHQLAVRVYSGMQSGYEIYGKNNLRKPRAKNVSGRKPKHGTKTPIKGDTIHHGT